MSKLRAAISFKHRVDEVKTIQQKKLRENIAGPILNIDDSNLEIQENPTNLENQQETNIQDDDSDDENNESQITSNWNSLINTWEQLLLQEEKAEEDAETDLNDDYNNEINEILLNNKLIFINYLNFKYCKFYWLLFLVFYMYIFWPFFGRPMANTDIYSMLI